MRGSSVEKIATLSERLVVVRELEHPDAMQQVLAAVYLLATCRVSTAENVALPRRVN